MKFYIIIFFAFSCCTKPLIKNGLIDQHIIDLSGLEINEIPDSVFEKVNVTHLFLGPKSLVVYPPLTYIPERPNSIKEIPYKVYRMENLSYLDITANKIENLPESITKNIKLDTLILDFNVNINIEKNLPVLEKLSKHLKYLSVIGIIITEEQEYKLLSINPALKIETTYTIDNE